MRRNIPTPTMRCKFFISYIRNLPDRRSLSPDRYPPNFKPSELVLGNQQVILITALSAVRNGEAIGNADIRIHRLRFRSVAEKESVKIRRIAR